MNLFLRLILAFILLTEVHNDSDFCYADEKDDSCTKTKSVGKRKRYLLYDVNPGEGFNLRRDVYMRMAVLVKKLNNVNEESNWVLVLPPWGPLYHWKRKDIGYQSQIKWDKFFDLQSLKQYVPVLELEEFLSEHGSTIDILYYLQHYSEGWTNNKWEERADIRDCIDPNPYRTVKGDRFVGWFWGYEEITSKEVHCLSIQGYCSTLGRFIQSSNAMAVMIDRAEVILHDSFGDKEYWMVRRSMVFSKTLTDIGDSFRKSLLNSTDEQDKTAKPQSLTSPITRKAVGGPYVAVHLRRRDFVSARPKEVPSIAFAAKQISKQMDRLNLRTLFVATDALQTEFEEIHHHIPGGIHFYPDKDVYSELLDGGVAIVDQWICAHARYFIGTFESTFSFRIQEEREILGFPVETTFNRLCGDNQTSCTQPSKWTIAF